MYGDFMERLLEAQRAPLRQLQQQLNSIKSVELMQAEQLARDLMKSVTTTSNPQNIEDARSVKVGDVYLVNVVRGNEQWLNFDLPILGPLHEDSEIPEMGASDDHWHIDWRFIPEVLHRVMTRAFGQATGGAMEDLPLLMMHLLVNPEQTSKPERRALRCVRPHSHFTVSAQPWLAALEKANEDKKVCDNICPHRGFSLVGAVEDANGDRLCPGHGLAWSKQGNLVRQTT